MLIDIGIRRGTKMNKIVLFGTIFFVCIFSVNAVQLPQLTYHHMGSDAVSEYVTQANFTSQMKWLYDNGFQSCSIDKFINNKCADNSFIVVFDDNNMDDITMFKPIMDKYGFKGTVAVVPIWLGSAGKLTKGNITTLSKAGWEIVSHSKDHADFYTGSGWLSQSAQMIEYNDSITMIKNLTGITPKYFIYPYNDADETTRAICMKYYKGCSGGSSYTTSQKDLYLTTGMDLINTGLVRVKVENTMGMTRFQNIFDYTTTNNTKIPPVQNQTNATIVYTPLNCNTQTTDTTWNINIAYPYTKSQHTVYMTMNDVPTHIMVTVNGKIYDYS